MRLNAKIIVRVIIADDMQQTNQIQLFQHGQGVIDRRLADRRMRRMNALVGLGCGWMPRLCATKP